MVFCEIIANLSQDGAGLIRFHGQDKDFGKLRYIWIERGGFGPGLLCERGASGVNGVAGDDLFRRDQARPNEALGQGRGHFACAQKADGEPGGHVGFVTGRLGERKRKGPSPDPLHRCWAFVMSPRGSSMRDATQAEETLRNDSVGGIVFL